MIEVDVKLHAGAFFLNVAFANNASITALFGPSGSGKSLTLHLVAGLLRPDQGRVVLNGVVFADAKQNIFVPMHRRRIGVVFQESNLFPHLSVKQNLLYGRWFAPQRECLISFPAAIEILGIGALLTRLPAGLSGGEKQRVAIGRALLSGPRLLLFDEPLAALDIARRQEILPFIERVRDEFKIPIVYVSHAIEEVMRLADSVVVMEAGRVKSIGSPSETFGRITSQIEGSRFNQLSVLTAVVDSENTVLGLTKLQHPAGTIWIIGRAGQKGHITRVIVRAIDVVLAKDAPAGLSTRSVLSGTIAKLAHDGPLVTVEITLKGEGYLLAIVTRGGYEELDLKPGMQIFALFKASAVDEQKLL